MSTSDSEFRSLVVYQHILVDEDGQVRLRDTGVYSSSDADGYHDIHADVGIRLNQNTAMASGMQLDASEDGVVTLVKAGAVGDGDFTNDTNGLIAIDSSNGRIYVRYGGGWHYAAVDAGLQLPEKTCYICGKPFKVGDNIVFRVDKFMNDNVPHMLPIHEECK